MEALNELRAIPLFAELAEEVLRDVALRVQRRAYAEGEIIVRAGDAPREMHFVLDGAVRVELGDGAGATGAILAAGHSFGEMSVLSGNPVSATVVAHTDSSTLAIKAEDLAAVLEREPALYRRISMLLIERLRHRTQLLASRLRPALAVLALDRGCAAEVPVVPAIFRGVGHYAPGSRLFDAREADAAALQARIARWRSEGAAGEFLVIATDAERFAELRFSLLAGDAAVRITSRVDAQREERLETGAADARSVLLDCPASVPRAGAWRESLSADEAVECARAGKWKRAAYPCVDRTARFITRREVGVAMSIGAAAGFAHLGFLQVLEDCGMPIDFVCGSSMGGVVALGFAQLRDISKVTDALCALGVAFAKSRGLQVVPRAALVSTQRMRQIAKEMFGEAHFAELGLPAAVIAADLVAGERVVLDRGPVAEAARATIAIPGIFPPVRIGNRILVDGGLAARLPADLLARRRCGLRIASVILPQRPAPQRLGEEAERLQRRLDRPLGLRAALGASWRMLGWWDSAAQAGKADLFIRIPTPVGEGYDFAAGMRMVEAGRRAALEHIQAIRDAARRLLEPGAP